MKTKVFLFIIILFSSLAFGLDAVAESGEFCECVTSVQQSMGQSGLRWQIGGVTEFSFPDGSVAKLSEPASCYNCGGLKEKLKGYGFNKCSVKTCTIKQHIKQNLLDKTYDYLDDCVETGWTGDMKWVGEDDEPLFINVKAGQGGFKMVHAESTKKDKEIKIYFEKTYKGVKMTKEGDGLVKIEIQAAEETEVGKSYSMILWAEQEGTKKIKRTIIYTVLSPDAPTSTTSTASTTPITPTVQPDVLNVPPTEALNPLAVDSVQALIGNAIKTLMGLLGSIALAMFVYGGVLWMTAMGNGEKTKKATQIIVWSSLGVLVILSSWTIVDFVFEAFR